MFRKDRLEKLSEIESWHFWFASRAKLVLSLVNKFKTGRINKALDLGCGTGEMVKTLANMEIPSIGLDIHSDYMDRAQENSMVIGFAQSSAVHLPVLRDSFDLVLALDILEHVDDVSALSQCHRILMPGGLLIVSVPAFSWLWSFRDVDAGHLRRYQKSDLEKIANQTGFEVKTTRYYQFFLFPFLAISRWFGKKGATWRNLEEKPFPILNTFLSLVNHLEVLISNRIPLPWGSTLVIVCKKQ